MTVWKTVELVSLLGDEAGDESDYECVVIEETGARSVHSLMSESSGKRSSECTIEPS